MKYYNLKHQIPNRQPADKKNQKKLKNFGFRISDFGFPASQTGQALVTLLFFVVVSIIITSGTVIVIILNSQSISKFEQGVNALSIAESGAENALLRLLRNPGYTGEPPLNIGDGTATIHVSGTSPVIIVSEGTIGNFTRKIQVEVSYNEGIMVISSWKEI